MLYHSRTGGRVTDICELEEGRLLLLVEANRSYQLAELDSVTGAVTKIDGVALESGVQYISASEKGLKLLDSSGFWHVDLRKGVWELELPFAGTSYTLQDGRAVSDFWVDGNHAGIIWDTGVEEKLSRVNAGEDREIIIVRNDNFASNSGSNKWLKSQVHRFNQSSDTYYAVLEECGEGTDIVDFRTQTGMQIASGKEADIIYGRALSGNIYDIIENGIFADLTPLMEASGMSEEDYFPEAFDVWRHDGKIYGVITHLFLWDSTMEKSIWNSQEALNIGTLLDMMLESDEKRCLWKGADAGENLEYLLKGTEDLWGRVDWEKGTCDFGGELFARMLRAAQAYAYDGQHDYQEVLKFRTNGHFFSFDTDSELEEKGLMAVGTLFDDRRHAQVMDTYAFGINAGSKHVEGAWQLISFLLGEEAQAQVQSASSPFPVNRKAFDRLAREAIETGPVVIINGHPVKQGDGKDITQEDVDEMIRYLEDARCLPIRTKPLISIILDESWNYFNGTKEIPQVVEAIENRVGLYLKERM